MDWNEARARLRLSVLFLSAVLLLAAQTTALPHPAQSTPVASQAERSGWTNAGELTRARSGQTATALLDGRILVAGGQGTTPVATKLAELYDPITMKSKRTGSLTTPRLSHTAILLPSGRVLVIGGDPAKDSKASAEIYDPSTGKWTLIKQRLPYRRSHHTATLLKSGKVLVSGGRGDLGPDPASRIYDTQKDRWSPTNRLNIARQNHTATLLAGSKCHPHCGKVLAVGGKGADHDESAGVSSELYDPANGTWTKSGTLAHPKMFADAALLQSGRILAAGGLGELRDLPPGTSAEIYDPVQGTWSRSAPMGERRFGPEWLTPLSNGMVLAAGGNAEANTSELYEQGAAGKAGDPTGSWKPLAPPKLARVFSTATLLNCGPRAGNVLLAGGIVKGSKPGESIPTNAVEMFRSPDTEPAQPNSGACAKRSDIRTDSDLRQPKAGAGPSPMLTAGAILLVVLAVVAAKVTRGRLGGGSDK